MAFEEYEVFGKKPEWHHKVDECVDGIIENEVPLGGHNMVVGVESEGELYCKITVSGMRDYMRVVGYFINELNMTDVLSNKISMRQGCDSIFRK